MDISRKLPHDDIPALMKKNRGVGEPVFQKASDAETDRILALYKSLVGTPYCAWDDDYPNRKVVQDDIAAGALYTLKIGPDMIAAGTIRHWPEHDELPCWPPMKHPCDLMRIGVARSFQGQGIGRAFLKALLAEAECAKYDFMRVLVAKNNLPAIALYRRMGASFHGEAFSYGINWLCCLLATKNESFFTPSGKKGSINEQR